MGKFLYAICEKEGGPAKAIWSNFNPNQMTEWLKDPKNWVEERASSEEDKDKLKRFTKLPDGTRVVTIMFQKTKDTWDSRIRGFRTGI